MKKVLSAVAAVAMLASMTACGGATSEPASTPDTAKPADTASQSDDSGDSSSDAAPSGDQKVINLWSFTEEVPGMAEAYAKDHPDFAAKYKISKTVKATDNGAYQNALDQALAAGGKDAPDLYCAEAAFVLKYTQGAASQYVGTYEDLGIDVSEVDSAEIAQYSVDIGTKDGKLVGLPYQATGGCFIYRRSLAKEAFGTDDPAEISKTIGGGSGSWDKFWEAAATLKSKGIAAVSGDGDIWHAVENSSDQGWVVDGKLTIDPKREEFLDLSKQLKDKGWHNDTQDWQDAWFADMQGAGEQPVFGFFGPAWLINYTIVKNCGSFDADGNKLEGQGTFGDWAVCDSPIGFFWGGTWLLSNKDSQVKEGVGEFIHWVTLDTTEDGLQYKWANGTYGVGGSKDTVASNVVMKKSDGTLDFLGGQNMFDYFVPANEYATGKNLTEYDENINNLWRDQVRQYTAGNKTRDEAIADFKQAVGDSIDIEVE
jgi:ABC-type glycerol-3-phosphate transport system substrate-binding protein